MMVQVYFASPSNMMDKKKKLPKRDIKAGIICFKCYKIIKEGDIIWSLEKYTHYDCNYPHKK